MLTRAQVESASDIAARELFDAIVDGRIPPGSPLRLKELSEQLGMSMMPVREAIRRLNPTIPSLATLRDTLLPKLLSGEIVPSSS